jgi:hypothetical protein
MWQDQGSRVHASAVRHLAAREKKRCTVWSSVEQCSEVCCTALAASRSTLLLLLLLLLLLRRIATPPSQASGFDNPYGMYGIRREYRAFFCGQNGNPVQIYVRGDMANGAPINVEVGKMGIPFSSQLHAILQTGT